MFIYWKNFAEVSLSFTEPHKKNANQNKNSRGKQTHSWMDLLAIIESHHWGFPGVTKKGDRLANTFKFVEGIYDNYSKSKDMADFLDLKIKLEPSTFEPDFHTLILLVASDIFVGKN